MNSLSIVTVSMNRTAHLLQQATAVSKLCGHGEHIILDYGSTTPISCDQLPSDERIKLHRVESPSGRWWLTHSYNLAFALAGGDYILKLDADILPSQRFIDALSKQQAANNPHLMCNRLTFQDWHLPSELFTTNGLFLCKRLSLAQIGGFNPYIQGWGWDEIDLYSRFFMAGFPVARMPADGLIIIQHGDDAREPVPNVNASLSRWIPRSMPKEVSAARRMLMQNEKNKRIALSSIVKHQGWPSFHDYAEAYRSRASLPQVPRAALFNAREKQVLVEALVSELLAPSVKERLLWLLFKRLGFGPFARSNASKLLSACNIDLSLVA